MRTRSSKFFGRRRDPLDRLLRAFQHRSARAVSDAEVDEEIEYHLLRAARELEHSGLSPAAARVEAERRFGDVTVHRARLLKINRRRGRKERLMKLLESTYDAVRVAVRSVGQSPAVSTTVVITMALGIGANATMFGIVDRLLLQPPAEIVDAASVVRVLVQRRVFSDRVSTGPTVSYPDYRDFDAVEAFSDTATYSWTQPTIGHAENARKVEGRRASPSLFTLLGVQPVIGRFYTEEEDIAGVGDVVVLGYELWQREFGGQNDALGKHLELSGIAHTVVGVAPAGFTGVGLRRVDLWVPLRTPLAANRASDDPFRWEHARGWLSYNVVARLRPGVDAAVAEAEATAIHRASHAELENYDPDARILTASLIAARGPNPSNESIVARWLAGVSAIVLIIACANVANILLARSIRRRRDLGVRLALGISTRRLIGQLLAESVVLAAIASAAALIVATLGGQAVRALLLPDVHWVTSPVNSRVLWFTLLAALGTGIVAGVAPALDATRQDVVSILASGARAGTRRSRLRNTMLILQTTLSVVLLVGAGLFVKSLNRINRIDLGFDAGNVLVVTPHFEDDATEEQRREYLLTAARRAATVPGVERAAVATSVPFYSHYGETLYVPGVASTPQLPSGGPYIRPVGADYFETMGIGILRGRGFTDADTDGSDHVAVVEETMARLYWPDDEALGKCVHVGGEDAPCSTVIGVVKNTARASLVPSEEIQFYVPSEQSSIWPAILFVRISATELDDETRAMLAARVHSGASEVRAVFVDPLRTLIDPQARSWQLGAAMFTIFGALALVIAAVGLYAVLAFSVAQRRHEIGVRAALGADSGGIVRMIAFQALRLVVPSTVVGLIAAAIASRWIEPLLYDVSGRDAGVLTTVFGVLVVVGVAAALIPARRAVAVPPIVALRAD